MIDINYHYSNLSIQSDMTLSDFLQSPLESTYELMGFKLSAGSRLPHCSLIALSSPDKPQTIYSILQDQFPKIQLLFFSSDIKKATELINYVHSYFNGIYVRFICASTVVTERSHDISRELLGVPDIPRELFYYDYNGTAAEKFNGWDIILVRPDCYVEYLGRPNEHLATFFSFLEKVFIKNK